jgi:hypothetical protein
MASCATCKSTIMFGGVRDGARRYCNANCHAQDEFVRFAQTIPSGTVQQAAAQIHRGRCPSCQGSGPVEYHVSHRVWSLAVVTQWRARPAVCCRRCANRRKLGDALFSALAGWWGFPWGFLMTPVQIVRNLAGLRFSDPVQSQPSDALLNHVRLVLAQDVLERQQRVAARA